ncbi:MAG: NTP transferase domain-containing protein [Deltaproteobacteria bacterium]|nr:NTP transferase domain-containing protein [Deltaproteobacteria bacterium]
MTDARSNCAVVILAAGLGTRMKSEKAKVLHEIMGRPMILYVAGAAKAVAGTQVVLVVGHQAQQVKATVSEEFDAAYALQEQQLGTGHAVLCAMDHVPEAAEHVIILCGDVPLLQPRTIVDFVSDHQNAGRDLSILAVELDNPTGYGRLLLDQNSNLIKIVEEADATGEQKKTKLINTGIYCVEKGFLAEALGKIGMDNAQDEMYLTDIIEIGSRSGKRIGVMIGADSDEVMGVNSRQDLARAEDLMQKRAGKKP